MADAANVVTTLLALVWNYFSIEVPGFSFSFGDMFLGSAVISIAILMYKSSFGVDGGSTAGHRAGSGRRGKVSKERRNDRF